LTHALVGREVLLLGTVLLLATDDSLM